MEVEEGSGSAKLFIEGFEDCLLTGPSPILVEDKVSSPLAPVIFIEVQRRLWLLQIKFLCRNVIQSVIHI